jgi:hypothetical protein
MLEGSAKVVFINRIYSPESGCYYLANTEGGIVMDGTCKIR